MLSFTYNEIGLSLVEHIPEFKNIYEEHVNQYQCVLQHVLFGDLVRFTRDICKIMMSSKGEYERERKAEIVDRILDFIEQALESNDERVTELVQVSFLENLHQLGECYDYVVKRLGARSKQIIKLL
ncbi:MAG: hypothetical protein CVU44_19830 [Chloroflexi bacterium HGW-Chloroflexi-6]|nr:MAG: hypothetical protein CVU44_19830 [Chloroflexi bacterium HGW-Chloroflexi-6]